MTFVIHLNHRMVCCVFLFPQDQTLHSLHQFLHLLRESPANCQYLLSQVVPSQQRTLQSTTHKGIQTILHPTLSRRFRTNDHQLWYHQLPCDMFTDTLQAKTRSWFQQNKYAQVFATGVSFKALGIRTLYSTHVCIRLSSQMDNWGNTQQTSL